MKTLYRPELLYSNGRFIANGEVQVNENGQFSEAPKRADTSSTRIVDLPGKAPSARLRECSFSFFPTAHSWQVGIENRQWQ